ncbi:hypothetical protein RKD28_006333 [Streptomyces sp. SAI-229]
MTASSSSTGADSPYRSRRSASVSRVLIPT